jgi:hypothetical protein
MMGGYPVLIEAAAPHCALEAVSMSEAGRAVGENKARLGTVLVYRPPARSQYFRRKPGRAGPDREPVDCAPPYLSRGETVMSLA